MRDARLRTALATAEDATVEPPRNVIEAKVFAQPFQGVSPLPRTVGLVRKPLRLRLPREPFLTPPAGVGRAVLSKMRILLTASVSAGEQESGIELTGDECWRRMTRLGFAINRGPAARACQRPGACAIRANRRRGRGNTHFGDFSRTYGRCSLASSRRNDVGWKQPIWPP